MKARWCPAEAWADDLRAAGLDQFEALWRLPLALVDARNERGSGWSEVGHHDIQRGGQSVRLYIKRQQDYLSRTPAHPLAGEPTLAKEFRNIQGFARAGVPTLDVVLFAQQADGRALLVTEELRDYRPLDECLRGWREDPSTMPPLTVYWRVIDAAADLVANMHAHRYHHRCLYPKHLFLRLEGSRFDLRIIDLEKARRYGLPGRWRADDLAQLWRRSAAVSRSDGLRFLLCYLRKESLDSEARKVLRSVLRRAGKKGR